MENCCQSIVKCLIFIFNFVIAVAGLALVGLSAYVYTQSEDNTLISFIVIGIVIVIISFFGCYGSLSENKCMIYTYAFIIFIISLIEIFIAVSIYDYIPGLPQSMKADMDKHDTSMIVMQNTLRCCGVINYEDWNINSTAPSWNINLTVLDWNTNSAAKVSHLNIPESCCDFPPCDANNVYPEGCFEKMATLMTMSATAAICIALLQMIIGICSCWISHSSS